MSYPVLARRDTALDDAETVALLRDRLGDGVVGDVMEYGELTVDVAPTSWHAAAAVCRDEERLAFDLFDCLFGVDAGEEGLDVVAVLYSTSKGRRLMLRARCDGGRDDPSLPTITDLYAGANWHERETFDMFGIDFTDHPGLLPRILCVENFEGWPLRKEFPLASRVAKPWPGVKDPAEPDEDGNVVVREPAIGEAPGPSGLDEIIAKQAREANAAVGGSGGDVDPAADSTSGGADAANAASEEPIREEVQLDQELYDQLIADGKSERIARSKAKASFIKKQRAAAAEADAADGNQATEDDGPESPDGEVGGATEGETVEEAAPPTSAPQGSLAGAADGGDGPDTVASAADAAEATRADQAAARAAKAETDGHRRDEPGDDIDPIPSAPPPDTEADRADDASGGTETPGRDDAEAPVEQESDEEESNEQESAEEESVEEEEEEEEADEELDDDGPHVPEPGPFGAGSAHPRDDGSGPQGWDVKATATGNVYHTPDSPTWRQVEADVWFEDASTAEGAGFDHWDPYERTNLDAPGTESGHDPEGEVEASTGATASEDEVPPAPTGPGGSSDTHEIVGDDAVERVARASFGGDHDDVHDGPYGPGSALPAVGGAGPDGWSVKATSTGSLFHTPASPDFDAVMVDAWFVDEATARAAGFAHWDHEQRRDLTDADVGEGVIGHDQVPGDGPADDGDADDGDVAAPVGGTLARDGGPANPRHTGQQPRGFGALDTHDREPIVEPSQSKDTSHDTSGDQSDEQAGDPSDHEQDTEHGDRDDQHRGGAPSDGDAA